MTSKTPITDSCQCTDGSNPECDELAETCRRFELQINDLRTELAHKTKALEYCLLKLKSHHTSRPGITTLIYTVENWTEEDSDHRPDLEHSEKSRPIADGGPIGQGAARLLGVDIEAGRRSDERLCEHGPHP